MNETSVARRHHAFGRSRSRHLVVIVLLMTLSASVASASAAPEVVTRNLFPSTPRAAFYAGEVPTVVPGTWVSPFRIAQRLSGRWRTAPIPELNGFAPSGVAALADGRLIAGWGSKVDNSNFAALRVAPALVAIRGLDGTWGTPIPVFGDLPPERTGYGVQFEFAALPGGRVVVIGIETLRPQPERPRILATVLDPSGGTTSATHVLAPSAYGDSHGVRAIVDAAGAVTVVFESVPVGEFTATWWVQTATLAPSGEWSAPTNVRRVSTGALTQFEIVPGPGNESTLVAHSRTGLLLYRRERWDMAWGTATRVPGSDRAHCAVAATPPLVRGYDSAPFDAASDGTGRIVLAWAERTCGGVGNSRLVTRVLRRDGSFGPKRLVTSGFNIGAFSVAASPRRAIVAASIGGRPPRRGLATKTSSTWISRIGAPWVRAAVVKGPDPDRIPLAAASASGRVFAVTNISRTTISIR